MGTANNNAISITSRQPPNRPANSVFENMFAITAATSNRQAWAKTSGSICDNRAVERVMASISVRPEIVATANSPRPPVEAAPPPGPRARSHTTAQTPRPRSTASDLRCSGVDAGRRRWRSQRTKAGKSVKAASAAIAGATFANSDGATTATAAATRRQEIVEAIMMTTAAVPAAAGSPRAPRA